MQMVEKTINVETMDVDATWSVVSKHRSDIRLQIVAMMASHGELRLAAALTEMAEILKSICDDTLTAVFKNEHVNIAGQSVPNAIIIYQKLYRMSQNSEDVDILRPLDRILESRLTHGFTAGVSPADYFAYVKQNLRVTNMYHNKKTCPTCGGNGEVFPPQAELLLMAAYFGVAGNLGVDQAITYNTIKEELKNCLKEAYTGEQLNLDRIRTSIDF